MVESEADSDDDDDNSDMEEGEISKTVKNNFFISPMEVESGSEGSSTINPMRFNFVKDKEEPSNQFEKVLSKQEQRKLKKEQKKARALEKAEAKQI